MVALRNPAGNYIAPGLPGIAAAAAQADWAGSADLVMTLVNQPGAESYPIAQTSYVQMLLRPRYIPRSQAVRDFFDFGYRNGGAVAAEFGFVPLPEAVQQRVRDTWERIGS
jgi:phosphate transport system substrate-binding protein